MLNNTKIIAISLSREIIEIPLISLNTISCLMLDIKFIFFFRAFESFGIYFAIMISVARKIISFLFILFLIIVSFAHAFFVLLKPQEEFSEVELGNLLDSNNPWSLTDKYHQVLNGTINSNLTLYKEPDEYTNLFSSYPDSLLAMYLFLTGIIIEIYFSFIYYFLNYKFINLIL